MLGSSMSRMDVKKTAGTESTIFNGPDGIFEPASGLASSISSDVSTLGILAFQRLLAPGYPATASILCDQGNVTLGGQSLHRITLDDPATDGQGNSWKTVDLYLSPLGQLVESVAFVHLTMQDASLYTLETSYSGYEFLNAATLPHTISQSLNGQPLWTITLNTIDLSVLPPSSLFNF